MSCLSPGGVSQWLQVISGTLTLVTAPRPPRFFHPLHRTILQIKHLNVSLTFPHRFHVKDVNFHCSLCFFSLFFSSLEKKRRSTVPDTGRTDTSKTFLIKKVDLKWKESNDGSDRQQMESFPNLFYVCVIRTWHSWCTFSKFWLWIFSRLLQDQPQRAIEVIASEK